MLLDHSPCYSRIQHVPVIRYVDPRSGGHTSPCFDFTAHEFRKARRCPVNFNPPGTFEYLFTSTTMSTRVYYHLMGKLIDNRLRSTFKVNVSIRTNVYELIGPLSELTCTDVKTSD